MNTYRACFVSDRSHLLGYHVDAKSHADALRRGVEMLRGPANRISATSLLTAVNIEVDGYRPRVRSIPDTVKRTRHNDRIRRRR